VQSFRDSLAIRERLAAADPGNDRWQFGLMSSYWRLAKHGDDPVTSWERIVAILQRLKGDGHLSVEDAKLLPEAEERLAAARGRARAR
jgi:hypothetical protein